MNQTESSQLGRVIAAFGRHCVVESDADGRRHHCKIRRKAGRPVCGDRVTFAGDGEDAVIEQIEPRDNFFPRADRRGRKQIVAANIDRIVVVIAPSPEPTRDLVNRYLVACESVGVNAVLCINKRDLLDPDQRQAWEDRAQTYRELGYPVLFTSAKEQHGLRELREVLQTGISIFVGQSGVGKSSLVNSLIPDLDLKTQEISDATGKGRHTTTASTLYSVSETGAIIDSPGVWEYGIWTMEAAEVAAGFREFQDYLGECRFANCTHVHEPDCAVATAVEQERVSSGRLDSYRRIVGAMQD